VPTRIAVVQEPAHLASRRSPAVGAADVLLDWTTDRANAIADCREISSLAGGELPPLCLDLLDVASAIYLSDIAVQRGRREAWTRQIELLVPVREVGFWTEHEIKLRELLYALTRDNWGVEFYQATEGPEAAPAETAGGEAFDADCVSLLSGGVDSLAGAVMLQSAGRRPLYVLHRAGNPTVESAQRHVMELLAGRWPRQNAAATARVAPHTGGDEALPFVPPEERENSRRARSLLYMALAVAAAVARKVAEVYLCDNGVLTAGMPMSPARAGSMSTHSTHPVPMAMFNQLCQDAGLGAHVTNPLLYQTKGDVVRDILKPALSPADIQSTVSCWATGRKPRQCGGCIPCLLRRLAMAYAGLPDEAYMIDVLGEPRRYVGTDAYGNLVDLLGHAQQMLTLSDAEMLVAQPDLLELHAAGVNVSDVMTMLRRHGEQVRQVVREHFPQTAALMSD